MGAVVGLGFGIGVVLIWSAFFVPPPKRRVRVTNPLQDRLNRAGLSGVRPSAFVTLCVVCGVVTLLAIQIASRTPPVALVFGLMATYLPVAILGSRIRRRQREFAEVWPEAVDNLASAVRAGLSLPEALTGLSVRGPEPLRPDFASFALDYQISGRFAESLDRLKDSLADPIGDRVVESLRIAREVGGGDLGRLLRSLSAFLREESRTRSELESRQSWTVNGARLAVAAPWLVLLLLCLQPDVIRRYATPGGTLVLGFGVVMCLVAYRLMVRIGRLPTEGRTLSGRAADDGVVGGRSARSTR